MKYKYKDLTREERGVTSRSSDFQSSSIVFIFCLACLAVVVVSLVNQITN